MKTIYELYVYEDRKDYGSGTLYEHFKDAEEAMNKRLDDKILSYYGDTMGLIVDRSKPNSVKLMYKSPLGKTYTECEFIIRERALH
jgi:hypothetical protein